MDANINQNKVIKCSISNNRCMNASINKGISATAQVNNSDCINAGSTQRGIPGPQGIPGEAATISVGSVSTSAAGTDATVINSGTSSAAVFDFVIPRGDTGAAGADGTNATITEVTASVDSNVGTPSVSVTIGGTESARTFDFAFHNLKGSDGVGAVTSVNGQTGTVVLSATDVGALPDTTTIPVVPTVVSAFTNDAGYITGIDYSDVTTALGYTPYDSANPNGYTSNVGTVTSVNNILPVSGNVTLEIPSRNIGEIVASTIPLTDAGLHLLDGSQLQYGSYQAFIDYIADLYDSGNYTQLFDTEANWQSAVTAYGVCGKFVYDSVNQTVRLPKITGFIEGASGTATLGDLVQAGLPNITGEFTENTASYNAQAYGQGAFGKKPLGVTGAVISFTSSTNYYQGYIDFDASRSSSVYGNSNTVQPQSVKVLYYIVIATTTKTAIEVDIDEIATDLNNKADVDLSNINASCAPIDGQWVESKITLANNISAEGSYECDLSSYLPNDNHTYEVFCQLYATDDHTSSTTNVWTVLGTVASPRDNNCLKISVVTDTYADKAANSGILPVDTNRKLYYQISGRALASTNGDITAFGYRRMGTNS